MPSSPSVGPTPATWTLNSVVLALIVKAMLLRLGYQVGDSQLEILSSRNVDFVANFYDLRSVAVLYWSLFAF
jgi:hypothetical protein